MIDSHCHLNFASLKSNINQIIKNAKDNNITSILSINTIPEEFLNHYNLIKDFQSVFISYGLHPENVNDYSQISKELILKYCEYDKVIGIGETGIDLYHSFKYKNEQFKIFENHIEASIETNLPLIIHQRNSEDEIIDILKSYQKERKLNIVFHCFTGSEKLKKFCINNEYYISLSGIVTFKNAADLRNIIKDIPISFLLIETDSPFLTPVPFRGKPNEPAHVKYVGEFLSNFFNIPLDLFIRNIDNNFYKLFSKAIRYTSIN